MVEAVIILPEGIKAVEILTSFANSTSRFWLLNFSLNLIVKISGKSCLILRNLSFLEYF